MQGDSALRPGKLGPWRREKIGIAINTSATPRAICCASALRSTGKPSIATRLPTRNSHARGGLMKKALAERSVCMSHTLSANDASASAPSTTGSAMLLPRTKSAHSNNGSAR